MFRAITISLALIASVSFAADPPFLPLFADSEETTHSIFQDVLFTTEVSLTDSIPVVSLSYDGGSNEFRVFPMYRAYDACTSSGSSFGPSSNTWSDLVVMHTWSWLSSLGAFTAAIPELADVMDRDAQLASGTVYIETYASLEDKDGNRYGPIKVGDAQIAATDTGIPVLASADIYPICSSTAGFEVQNIKSTQEDYGSVAMYAKSVSTGARSNIVTAFGKLDGSVSLSKNFTRELIPPSCAAMKAAGWTDVELYMCLTSAHGVSSDTTLVTTLDMDVDEPFTYSGEAVNIESGTVHRWFSSPVIFASVDIRTGIPLCTVTLRVGGDVTGTWGTGSASSPGTSHSVYAFLADATSETESFDVQYKVTRDGTDSAWVSLGEEEINLIGPNRQPVVSYSTNLDDNNSCWFQAEVSSDIPVKIRARLLYPPPTLKAYFVDAMPEDEQYNFISTYSQTQVLRYPLLCSQFMTQDIQVYVDVTDLDGNTISDLLIYDAP